MNKPLWKNLGLALAGTPAVVIGGLFVIALIGGIDSAITKIQIAGRWWILLIIGFVISLIYVYYEPKFKRDRERKKFADALILHWKWQFAKQNKPMPSEYETELIQEELIERIKVWAWSDPQLWARFFPNEKYSEDPFKIIDMYEARIEEWKRMYLESQKD